MAAYSPQEKQYYDQLFSTIDKDDAGVLPGQSALPFLLSSSLSQQVLGEIWAISDPENNGFLTREGWYKAARIIGWLQKGGKTQVEDSLATTAGPYPSFTGQPPPPPQASAPSAAPSASLPPLTAADRTKFTRLFVGCGPSNGLVTGEKARDVFVKSKLSYEKLGQIWNLADTQQRGSLDLPDFIIGMYLIQSCMSNPNLDLPASLPAGTYEQASGGRPPPPTLPSSPIARQNTGGGAASPIARQYTGQNPNMGILQPQRTGQSISGPAPVGLSTPPRSSTFNTFSSPTKSGFSNAGASAFGARQNSLNQPWDVTAAEKASSDGFFAVLDPQGKGVIEGEVAVPFMLQSQLDEGTLASIWDLADIRHEGKLTREEFAVAMYLINGKMAGRELPTTLPNSLIPPSLREEFGAGAQEVLAAPQSAAKDLFDLSFDDTPPPAAAPPPAPEFQQQSRQNSAIPAPQAFSTQNFMPPTRQLSANVTGQRQMSPMSTGQQGQGGFGMAAFAPQPAGDLLGDDSNEPAPAVPDNSAEIGNKQNQLANTSRSVADLEKTHAGLDTKAKSSQSELDRLEAELSSAKAKHETETKAVSDLRIRVAQQTTTLKQLQTDVISAESDLSAMKSEKDELGQTLLRDKEEVRGLQKRMKEIEDEKTGLKLVLEKLKKEARQQKGMVSIAKKQVTTAEGSRDAVQADIKEEERKRDEPVHEEPVSREVSSLFSPTALATAASVPLPGTPKALSPAPTGTSQRSNNPFDRFTRTAPPASPPVQQAKDITEPDHTRSPSFGTTALLGAGAAVGLAAGVVATGAAKLFDAAKEVVTGEEAEPTKEVETESDPFGAPVEGKAIESDPFGAPASAQPVEPETQAVETDPFGMPAVAAAVPKPTPSAFDSEFESGFGDSFGSPPTSAAAIPVPGPASTETGPTDFDTAFADFDDAQPIAPPHVVPPTESALAAKELVPEPEVEPTLTAIPSGIPVSAIPANLRPEVERTTSTVAVAPSSQPGTPTLETETPTPVNASGNIDLTPAPVTQSETVVQSAPGLTDEEASSDEEEEGPEDLEAPKSVGYIGKGKGRAIEQDDSDIESSPTQSSGAVLAPPIPVASTAPMTIYPPVSSAPFEDAEPSPKLRRSAPPPPPSRGGSILPVPAASTDDFDPFGSHAFTSTSPPTAIEDSTTTTKAVESGFEDEDDFDFSDLPPANVEHSSEPVVADKEISSSAFDDEFANFDDEFGKQEGSDNSNSASTGFEMVSPPVTAGHKAYDEWAPKGRSGSTPVPATATGAGALSFDDAFGNDFEPAPPVSAPSDPNQGFAPPPGAPPSKALAPPTLPERRASQPQADDLDDVKRLCAMGFSRTLAIDALEANDYDFQKTLNVLLAA